MINYQVFSSVDSIAEKTFSLLLSAETAALSFGSTYEGIFKKWKALWEASSQPALPAFFPADERLVDITDPGSNWGTVRKSFLNFCGSTDDAQRWASDEAAYRKFLTAGFGKDMPVFDLIFLGIGPDGHTASLFPGTCPNVGEPAWSESVLRTTAPFIPPERLTLGPELIAQAEKLVLTVTGRSKTEIFSQFQNELESEVNKETLPPVKIIKRRETLGLETSIFYDIEVKR